MDEDKIGEPQVVHGHRFDDVSYHGSPVWICNFCHVNKRDTAPDEPCPKALDFLAREARDRELAEQAEYARLKAARDRFEYLEKKYGNGVLALNPLMG